MKRWSIAILSCVCAFAGCSTRVGDFAIVSSCNVDLAHSACDVDKSRRISGKDTAFVFIVIPFGLPDYETAVSNAGKDIPGYVGLSNVAIQNNYFWLGLGYTEIEAVGYPIIRKGAL